MELITRFRKYKNVFLITGYYGSDGSLVLQAWNEADGPIATITKCLNDKSLERNEAYVDTNNFPEAAAFIGRYGLGEFTGEYRESGYRTYPLYRFNMDKIAEYEEGAA